MKFLRCYYFEPTNEIAHGGNRTKVDGKTVIVKDENNKLYISLSEGIIVENENGRISIRHLSKEFQSYSELVLFNDDTKEYSLDEIREVKKVETPVVETILEIKEELPVRRGRQRKFE